MPACTTIRICHRLISHPAPPPQPTQQTLLTFIVYLNEGFEGGETVFFPGGITGTNPPRREEVRVVPKTGMALVFFQAGQLNHRHEGAPHTSEDVQKFILRSDIAYQRAKPM